MSLVQVPAHVPEPEERRGQPQPAVPRASLQRGRQRRAQVVVLRLEPSEPLLLGGSLELRLGPLRQGQAPVPVPGQDLGLLFGVEERVARVVADRLRQAVPRLAVRHLGQHHRPVDEACAHVQRLFRCDPASSADRPLGGLEAEPAPEHRGVPEERPLRVRQEVVTPLDRGRSVWWRLPPVRLPPVSSRKRSSGRARSRPPRGPRRAPRPARSPAGPRPGGGRSAPPRGRCAPRARTQGSRRRRVRRTGAPPRSAPGPEGEAAAGLGERERGGRGRSARRRSRAARGWWPASAPARTPQQGVRQVRAGRDGVLAVGEHRQERLGAEELHERLHDRPPRLLAHPERGGDRVGEEARVREQREVDAPHAPGKASSRSPAARRGEPRLAGPAGPGERDRARRAEEAPDLRDLALPPDEARERAGRLRRLPAAGGVTGGAGAGARRARGRRGARPPPGPRRAR